MKKIFYLMISGFGLLYTISSCSKTIDDAYANPNSDVVKPIETLLPNVLQNMCISYTANGTNYGPQNDGIYIGRYVQFFNTASAGNLYDQMGGVTGASDILGSIWAMHYYGMGQNINRIIEWGTEQKKWDYVGVAHAIRAWGWLTLTDVYGPAILTDAFNTTQRVFTYQAQEEIYEEVKKEYFLAMENLNKTGDGVSQANLALGDGAFYNGDVEKWKKFANTVMARVYHRTTNKSDYHADSVIHYAQMGILDNADNAMQTLAGLITANASFYGKLRNNAGTLAQSKFIADLMSGVNPAFASVTDPRAIYLLRKNTNGTFKGVLPGQGATGLVVAERPENFWGGTFNTTGGSNASARYVWKDGGRWPVMTAAETHFMMAEAYYRSGQKGNALTSYRNGISVNWDMLATQFAADIPAGQELTPAAKTTFLANPLVVPAESALNLSHIMLQKYIASHGYAMIETWTDMRRYHYTDIETATGLQVYRDFTLPATLYVNNNSKVVYRARPRYNSEFLYNIVALDAVGGRDLDYHTKEMWFSQP